MTQQPHSSTLLRFERDFQASSSRKLKNYELLKIQWLQISADLSKWHTTLVTFILWWNANKNECHKLQGILISELTLGFTCQTLIYERDQLRFSLKLEEKWNKSNIGDKKFAEILDLANWIRLIINTSTSHKNKTK